MTSDFRQGTGLGAIVGDELSSDGEGLGGINGIARPPVVGHALSVGVEATAALVAVSGAAGVGSKGVGPRIALEDIHFVTAVARAVAVESAVLPGLDRALCIAVTRAVLGTTRVIFIPSTGGAHLGQVEGTVFTTGKSGQIHIKAELPAKQLHHHVVSVRSQEIESRRGIAVCTVALNVLVHGQSASRSGNTSSCIVGRIDDTVLGTSGFVGAEG